MFFLTENHILLFFTPLCPTTTVYIYIYCKRGTDLRHHFLFRNAFPGRKFHLYTVALLLGTNQQGGAKNIFRKELGGTFSMQYQFSRHISSSPEYYIHAMHYIQYRNCVEFLRSLFLLTTCPNWMDEAGIYYNNIVYISTKSHFKGQLEGLLERKFIIINHRVNNFIINVKFHFESRQMIGQSFAKNTHQEIWTFN